MAKVFQFEFLLKRAIDHRDEAALTIGAAVSRLQQSRDRHAQVTQYRAEYHAKLEVSGRQGMSIHQWNDFQLFLAKLNTAVEQQAYDVKHCESLLDAAKAAWMICEREVKAYEALRDRHDEREMIRESKQDQKMSDEWAANMYRQRDRSG
jgi:flagellar FliJ protein